MMLSGSAYIIADELRKNGFSISEIHKYLYYAQNGNLSFYGSAAKTPAQNSMVQHICRNKNITKRFLNYRNYPTARSVVVSRQTVGLTEQLTFPVVIKPLDLDSGEGVVTQIKNIEQILEYFDTHPYKKVLVEEMLLGEDCRLLTINGKFFAACKRLPASILGNGNDSIEKLLKDENEKRQVVLDEQKSQQKLLTCLYPIVFDQEVFRTLDSFGLSLDYVPNEGERVFVRRNANVSSGGTSIDVTQNVSPEIISMAESISVELGASILGIDIMTNDLSQPLNATKSTGIVEINSAPYLLLHSHPSEGTPRNPAPLIVEALIDFLKKNPQANAPQL